MGRLNLRLGFNRIFIVLTVIWTLTVFVRPYFERGRLAKVGFESNHMIFELCIKHNEYQHCQEQLMQLSQATSNQWYPKDKNVYQLLIGNDYVLTMAATLVVPPALTYGIIFGMMKLFFWIRQGFKPKGDS